MTSRIQRTGAVVRRPAGSWSPPVHALLRHLQAAGFPAYGIAVPDDITAQVAWQQRLVLQTCEALAGQGIQPQATWVGDGYLDVIRARIDWTESSALR